MRQHLGFLKVSSAVVKVAAWIFLLLGISGSILIVAGKGPGKKIFGGVINLSAAVFFFFFFFFIAQIADLLFKIIKEIKKK